MTITFLLLAWTWRCRRIGWRAERKSLTSLQITTQKSSKWIIKNINGWYTGGYRWDVSVNLRIWNKDQITAVFHILSIFLILRNVVKNCIFAKTALKGMRIKLITLFTFPLHLIWRHRQRYKKKLKLVKSLFNRIRKLIIHTRCSLLVAF